MHYDKTNTQFNSCIERLCCEPIGLRFNPEKIAVVHQWGDLLKQPPIALEGGITVRLVLKQRNAPRRVGCCCIVSPKAMHRRSVGRNDILGPVGVDVLYPPIIDEFNYRRYFGYGLSSSKHWPKGLNKCTLLFIRPIMATRPCNLKIRVGLPEIMVGDELTHVLAKRISMLQKKLDTLG